MCLFTIRYYNTSTSQNIAGVKNITEASENIKTYEGKIWLEEFVFIANIEKEEIEVCRQIVDDGVM